MAGKPGYSRFRIRQIRLPDWPGPAAYASAPVAPKIRESLILSLMTSFPECGPAPLPVREPEVCIRKSAWGQPCLWVKGAPGPSLSFSRLGEEIWAAVAPRGSVGIDVASEREFVWPYPYSRAFRGKEWEWAWRHCQGRTPAAAALLWAAKEAAVKALGGGFHTRAPKDLEVGFKGPWDGGLRVTVSTPEAISVWLSPGAGLWLALALKA